MKHFLASWGFRIFRTLQELTITTQKSNIDYVTELLESFGALAVTYEDAEDEPILEPAVGEHPIWSKTKVTGLFDKTVDLEMILHVIKQQFPNEHFLHQIRHIADKEWERVSREHFKPFSITNDFWVCPSWCETPKSNVTVLRLDPGLAFGTGTHATTELCLRYLVLQPPQGLNVIDYGCGSGILGIGALLLGAHQIWAIDHDPQALLATRNNAEINTISSKQLITLEDDKGVQKPVDLLVANILATPLITLAPRFAALLKEDGQAVLSGVLTEQSQSIKNAYQSDFEFISETEKESWICLVFQRKNRLV